MAQSLLRLGRKAEARRVFHAALEKGLDRDRMQPFERDAFRRLQEILK
jgi:hypothetical protein